MGHAQALASVVDRDLPQDPVGRWLRGLIPPTPEPFIYPDCLLQSVEHDSEDERLAAVLLLLLGPA
ncbi:hypothetical protein [Cupriavidus metallidurans]|uniref:hypothetical protein n=1 Tax=Cupriavidus metallidurans TaxID=119219 RepID=UPI001CB8A00F|nr:hypothetical protein [Cupriavidus metallidurans]